MRQTSLWLDTRAEDSPLNAATQQERKSKDGDPCQAGLSKVEHAFLMRARLRKSRDYKPVWFHKALDASDSLHLYDTVDEEVNARLSVSEIGLNPEDAIDTSNSSAWAKDLNRMLDEILRGTAIASPEFSIEVSSASRKGGDIDQGRVSRLPNVPHRSRSRKTRDYQPRLFSQSLASRNSKYFYESTSAERA